MFLLDTNVVSEFVRPTPDHTVTSWVHSAVEERMFLSVVTIAELDYGIKKLDDGRRKSALVAWLDDELLPRFQKRILDVTPPVAKTWASLMIAARRGGLGLEAMDAFIAASALEHSLTLVTRNIRDFQPFGISLFNPWMAPPTSSPP